MKIDFEAFGCWLPTHFAQAIIPSLDKPCYIVMARSEIRERVYKIQTILTFEDIDRAVAIPWDTIYQDIRNKFVDAVKRSK